MAQKDSYKPNFKELARIEEEALLARIAAVRSSISHAGEKGRSLESEVMKLLRDFLPSEYGLSTGFVVWMSPDGPKLSQQLDIIIYDAVRYAPIVDLGSSCVFPLEGVYGYIEVKASLSSSGSVHPPSTSIQACIEQNKDIREMKNRRYLMPSDSSPIRMLVQEKEWLGIRSFVFAFEASGKTANNLELMAAAMRKKFQEIGNPAHFHGVYLGGVGYLSTRAVDVDIADADDYFHINHTAEHHLLAFKTGLFKALQSFPRPGAEWTPAIDRYYELASEWEGDTFDEIDEAVLDLGAF